MSELRNTTQMNQHETHPNDILKFKRFSAFYVFLLNRFTQNIYMLHWINTRSEVVNSTHENRIDKKWLYTMLLSIVYCIWIPIAIDFTGEYFTGENYYIVVIILLSLLIAFLLGITSYLVLIFKMKNRLKDIMKRTNSNEYQLSSLLTFFFGDMYLQYKINKCIDDYLKTVEQEKEGS